jgi:hypothetical protein
VIKEDIEYWFINHESFIINMTYIIANLK